MPRTRRQVFSASTSRLFSAMRRTVSDFDTSYALLAPRRRRAQRGAELTRRGGLDETAIRDGAVRGGAHGENGRTGVPEPDPAPRRDARPAGGAGGGTLAPDRRRAAPG